MEEYLDGCPQMTVMTVAYGQTGSGAQSKQRHKPYVVVKVTADADAPTDAAWEMTISPVPRKLKARVRQLLIHDGLPRLRTWLLSTPTPTPRDVPPHRKFVLSYDERADALTCDGA